MNGGIKPQTKNKLSKGAQVHAQGPCDEDLLNRIHGVILSNNLHAIEKNNPLTSCVIS